MPQPRLIVVLPCYALEDLPKNLDAAGADDFHAAWTSAWHPSLLPRWANLPEWKRSDTASLDVADALILLPAATAPHLDETLRERLDLSGNTLLNSAGSREANAEQLAAAAGCELLERSFDDVPDGAPGAAERPLRSPITPRTFHSLGYAYQQLHMLTRKVHYSTNLDVALFHEQLTSAAEAYAAGDAAETQRWLQSCFDSLSQERDRYFSQAANLLDLTLLADSTLGEPLARQLRHPHPQNILAPAHLLARMKQSHRESFDSILAGGEAGRCSLLGGLDRESPHPWLPAATLLRDLARGAKAYRDCGIQPPAVFSRLTAGWQGNDPQWLRNCGFDAAVLAAWLDGAIPSQDKAKIRWQAADAVAIDAVAGFVSDAASTLSLLSVAIDLAKQFDYHQSPTVVLTHWPEATCEAFGDLLLATERTTALGQWSTLEHYFEETGRPYSQTTVQQAQLPFPQIQTGPAQRTFADEYSAAWSAVGIAEDLSSWAVLANQLAIWTRRGTSESERLILLCNDLLRRCDAAAAARLSRFVPAVQSRMGGWSAADADNSLPDEEIDAARGQTLAMTAAMLSGGPVPTTASISQHADRPSARGIHRELPLEAGKTIWLLNPSTAPRRHWLRCGDVELESGDAERIYAQADAAEAPRPSMLSRLTGTVQSQGAKGYRGQEAVVDVPPHGVLQLTTRTRVLADQGGKRRASGAGDKAMIALSERLMTNEFLDVQIDPRTGHLRSLLAARRRGSRASGQLNIANPARLLGHAATDPAASSEAADSKRPAAPAAPDAAYATPVNVRLTLEHNSKMSAAIVARGVFTYRRRELAEFTVRYELWRGSRVLQITPHLKWLVDTAPPADGAEPDPWSAAAVWRTAWPSEVATVRTWPQGVPTQVKGKRLNGCNLVEIDDAEHRLYLLSSGGGLHRRSESRCFDTWLGGSDDAAVAVGLNLPEPLSFYDAWSSPLYAIEDAPSLPAGQASASLLRSSSRNLMIRWLPEEMFGAESEEVAVSTPQPAGARGHLLVQESMGKSSTARLSFFREVAAAHRVDLRGRVTSSLQTEGGDVLLPLNSCEVTILRLNWA